MPINKLNRRTAFKPSLNHAGFSLIEVLVSLFVLAIGLLGVIAMQINSVKSNQRAQYSSEVHFLAADFADRIYAYDDVDDDTDNDDYDNIDTDAGVTQPTCMAAGCGRADQRTLDIYEWKTQLENRLPAGRGTVDYDAGTEIYTISLMWDNERMGATGTGCSGDPTIDLACYVVEVSMR